MVALRFEFVLEAARLAPRRVRVSFQEGANRRPGFESTALLLVESRCSCGRTEDDDMVVGQLLANGVTAFTMLQWKPMQMMW